MKTRYIMLLCIIATIILSSCGKASYLKCDKDVVSTIVKGGTGTIAISCDGDVEIAYAPEWVAVELVDTVLKYNVSANKSNASRKDYVIVKSDTLSHAVLFNQSTRASYLIIPQTKVNINKEGVGTTLKVLTDGGEVKVAVPDGVTCECCNGELSFKSNGNTGQTKTSKINVTCDDLSKEITIVQSGNICETCHGKGRVVCYICKGEGVDYCPYRPCDICGGSGYNRCNTCRGTGK